MISKFLRFKSLMVSDDGGQTWLVVRQHYLTDDKNRFLDTLLQGRRFKMIGDLNERTHQPRIQEIP
jgi:hypothetical protein